MSMIHLIFIICFPLFQRTKSWNIKVILRPSEQFVKTTCAIVLFLCILKLVFVSTYIMILDRRTLYSCDHNELKAFGFVNEFSDLMMDALLIFVLTSATLYFSKLNNTSVSNEDLVDIHDYKKNCNLLLILKCSCLIVLCLNGIMVPSVLCCVYYVLFIMIMTKIVLFGLSNIILTYIFRLTCLYTCLHLLLLFTYQIEWIRNIGAVNSNLAKQFGLIAYFGLQCKRTEVLPVLQEQHYFLPITLIIQHYMLWTYSNMISKNTNSTTSYKLVINAFKLKNMIVIGIKTIGFKVVILVWSICYRGWITLVMLLWTTVFWMYLDTRPNRIIILLFAICMLFIEYIYIVFGNDLLKNVFGSDLKQWSIHTMNNFPTAMFIKTFFTIIFWIALDKTQLKPNDIQSKLVSKYLKQYIPQAWIVTLILIMFTYGFFGYSKIDWIQIGYIALALLFIVIFQVSFELWKKTMHLYWSIVILYSIVVICITYVFQFYGLSKILETYFHISNDLQRNIGLYETDYLRIIIPAVISIGILIHFHYFHEDFTKKVNVEQQTTTSENNNGIQKKKNVWISRILNTTLLVFHVHFNKLEIMLFVILIMDKPNLLNGILLVMMLLWILLNYNTYISKLLFVHISWYIIVILGYQLTYFDDEKWTLKFHLFIDRNIKNNISIHQEIRKLNIAKLFGLKKIDNDELLFHFLMYELLILLIMVLKKIISIYLNPDYYPQNQPTLIFSNIEHVDMNNGIPEFLMFLANYGFSLFGFEIILMTLAIAITLSTDAYALLYAILIFRFARKSRKSISSCWPYFITLIYLTVVFKYVLYIESLFLPNSDISWKSIHITNNVLIKSHNMNYITLIRSLMPFDFLLLVFVSNQMIIFKKENKTTITSEEEYPDYISQTESYLDVLKRAIFYNSLWIIIFCIYWNGLKNFDVFSFGYLCIGTILFWKSTYYYLIPIIKIIRYWNWLLYYIISVIFFKVLLNLLGCFILNYFKWYPCILMQFLSMYCSLQTFEEHQNICDTSKNNLELFWDVFMFTLVLFQRRFFKSIYFLKLIEDTKIVIALTSNMYQLINDWDRQKQNKSRQTDLDSLKKIKEKLNKIRKSKEQWAKKKLYHFPACGDGEYMFKEIDDNVHLVEKYDVNSFSKFKHLVNGPWIYRQFVCFIFYLTEKINIFSKEHRRILYTLEEKKKWFIMRNTDSNELNLDHNTLILWTPLNNYYDKSFTDINQQHYLIQFIMALWNAMKSSTHLICYFAIFYNMIHNFYDLISTIPVIMVILWGQLSVPRPTKTFWIVLITYIQITGLVKYIFSFKQIPWIQEESELIYSNKTELYLYPTIKIGTGNYQNKIKLDVIVLLFLFLHRYTLITIGLWTYNTDSKKSIPNKNILKNENELLISLTLILVNIKNHIMPIVEFYKDLRKHHTEGSVNVYPTLFTLIAIQIPCTLINSSTATKLFALNRVSIIFLQTFIIYIITIILDRWFYIKRYILGKLIFHVLFVTVFLFQFSVEHNDSLLYHLWAYGIYLYIIISAYQIRNGYLYRNASSFIWSRYTIFNLLLYKVYYYCPFVHEIRTVLDWTWSDSTLTITEWFKMDELFTHICYVKCIWNIRTFFDTERGHRLPQKYKLYFGGGIIISILILIIFPIAWFLMIDSKPDTPLSIELTITFGEDSTVFTTKSDYINRLDSTDFIIMKKIYSSSLKNKQFLDQYQFDEVSSINVIPMSLNTWPLSTYEFNKLKKIIESVTSSLKISVEWSLIHQNSMMTSRGKNFVIINKNALSMLENCFNKFGTVSPVTCEKLIVHNLVPKFLILHLKSSEVEVNSELMIHDSSKSYMDISLQFHYSVTDKNTYWCDMVEICPSDYKANYLKNLPYSSCADVDINLNTMNNIIYNIYVFSDRVSNTFHFLDDKGIIGLYAIIVVYFGYKLAFDIFRSFKFKLGYTETPYPDRILQLCYEIYLVRLYGEFEMEEDLYAMLIFLFRSPETLIRFTRQPN